METSKIDMSFNRIRRMSDLSDLAELLFPGNRNQQHAFLVVWLALKWADHRMVPNLADVAEQYGITKRTLERVRAKLRRMGLIEHISRFSNRFGYRDGWVLSHRFESGLRQLAVHMTQFEDISRGSWDKELLLVQLADARRRAACAQRRSATQEVNPHE